MPICAFEHPCWIQQASWQMSIVGWVCDLVDMTEPIRVAIEVTAGSVVEALQAAGMAVHSINPKQLNRYRDRFSLSGCKDDRRDALVLAHPLLTDAQCYRKLRRFRRCQYGFAAACVDANIWWASVLGW